MFNRFRSQPAQRPEAPAPEALGARLDKALHNGASLDIGSAELMAEHVVAVSALSAARRHAGHSLSARWRVAHLLAKSTVDGLLDMLASPDPDEMGAAAGVLAAAGVNAAVPALVDALGSDDPRRARHAASALATIGGWRAVEAVLALDTRRAETAISVSRALIRLDIPEATLEATIRGRGAAQVAAALAAGITGKLGDLLAQRAFDEKESSLMRAACTRAMGMTGGDRALGLAGLAHDHDEQVRHAACLALRRYMPGSAQTVRDRLDDPSPRVRQAAARILGHKR